MHFAIALTSAFPIILNLTCWLNCECTTPCPALGVAACTGIALVSSAAIFVTASIAWELIRLSQHRPPPFHTEAID